MMKRLLVDTGPTIRFAASSVALAGDFEEGVNAYYRQDYATALEKFVQAGP